MKTQTHADLCQAVLALCLAFGASVVCSAQSPVADGLNPGASGWVSCLAIQPDSKVVVGGQFTTLGGQQRRYVGRLLPDGTLDSAFDPSANGLIRTLAIQADGKILLGGDFTTMGGQSRRYIARVNHDGSLDSSFTPTASLAVEALCLQPDGKILIAGGGLQRVNPDGSVDNSFTPSPGVGMLTLALQADGKILVGGWFTSVQGQSRTRIARFLSDGKLDPAFVARANDNVMNIQLQEDHKILVAGSFTTLNGTNRSRIGRLNPDGSLDISFSPAAAGYVNCLTLQSDGKILVGGRFNNLAGYPCAFLGRLNEAGTLDHNFHPSVDDAVSALCPQNDGKLLVGGGFTNLAGQRRLRIGRLNAMDTASQSLSVSSNLVTWSWQGVGPWLSYAVFEFTTNSSQSWQGLGVGQRTRFGFQVNASGIPRNSVIRASGRAIGGWRSGTSWHVETNIIATAPSVTASPPAATRDLNSDFTLTAGAQGTPRLFYQWYFNNTAIPGAEADALVLKGLRESDQGLYLVVVTNAFGSVTSSPVLLVVNQFPLADAGATVPSVISSCDSNATVVLDGSRSSDPDGDALQYRWYAGDQLLASGMIAPVTLPVGIHPLMLVVDDGRLSATNRFTVEVATSAQAVEQLTTAVEAGADRVEPLMASLRAALASAGRCHPSSAVNQLLAFQNQVRAQVAPLDPSLADALIQQAQEIILALTGGNTNGGGHPKARITGARPQSDGRVQFDFTAPTGLIHILEASPNLVDWEMIAVATDLGEGNFRVTDANAHRFTNRFYRVVTP